MSEPPYIPYVDYGEVEAYECRERLRAELDGLATIMEARFLSPSASTFGDEDVDALDEWYRVSFEAVRLCIAEYLKGVNNKNVTDVPQGYSFQSSMVRRLSPRLYKCVTHVYNKRAAALAVEAIDE